MTTIALVDGNNFFASCEQVFDPRLAGRPLVVLSNNDGCIISRSQAAREMGIAMGTPYFKVADALARRGVAVRSANFILYGDMSRRLMACVGNRVEQLDVYSIDEAFARLPALAPHQRRPYALQLRQQVKQWLGLPVAVGIAPTKVLAKVANHLAKHHPDTGGVFHWDPADEAAAAAWLEQIPVEAVWGIGRRRARWCRLQGITSARQFRDAAAGTIRRRLGVGGRRLQLELAGDSCLPLGTPPASRQQVCVSRSFGRPVTDLAELRQAVATYTSAAAAKLRSQHQLAGRLTVFVRCRHGHRNICTRHSSQTLNLPSQHTPALLAVALRLATALHHPGVPLHKAGVLLHQLQPERYLQQHLLEPLPEARQQRERALMACVDELNLRYGDRTVLWAAEGLRPAWAMRCNHRSPNYTTRLAEIPVVQA